MSQSLISWKEVSLFWWSMMWRTYLSSLIFMAAVICFFTLIIPSYRHDPIAWAPYTALITLVSYVYFQIRALKRLLEAGWMEQFSQYVSGKQDA